MNLKCIVSHSLATGLFVGFSQLVMAQAVPPVATKNFTPPSITVGGTSQLVIVVDNSASGADATNLAVIDGFPTGMTVADPAGAASTCTGGTLNAVAGDIGISLTNSSVPAGASCQISVNVTAASVGALANTTAQVSSSAGVSAPASATLTVAAAPVSAAPAQPVPTLPHIVLIFLAAIMGLLGASRIRNARL
ncbi:MAG: hypothetical protein NXI15_18335 [Gammaproteobacteria bacterium]|nr:hypothetical protein [Gammaproteobacteria bacterium]